MLRNHSLGTAAAAAVLLLTPNAASAREAVCTFTFDVSFTANVLVQDGPGNAVCAGTVGSSTVDPRPVAARIGGYAKPGISSCIPVLLGGRVTADFLRLISFDPRPTVPFDAGWWTAVLPGVTAVRGSATARGRKVPFLGDMRFTPRTGSCGVHGFSPGTLHVDLVLGAAMPAKKAALRAGRRDLRR